MEGGERVREGEREGGGGVVIGGGNCYSEY